MSEEFSLNFHSSKIISEMIICVTMTARTLDIVHCRVSISLILRFKLSESVVKHLNCLTLSTNVAERHIETRDGLKSREKAISENFTNGISAFSDPNLAVTPVGFSRDNCSVYNAFYLVTISRVQIDCVRK